MIRNGNIEIVHALSAILGKKEKRGLSVEENVTQICRMEVKHAGD